MRLPLQAMPSTTPRGSTAPRGNIPSKPYTTKVPPDDCTTITNEDENGENHSSIANTEQSTDDTVKPAQDAVKEGRMSLVERRAALFGSVQNQRRRSRAAALHKTVECSVSEGQDSLGNGECKPSNQDVEVGCEKNEEAEAPAAVTSPSHLDFESKKKAIFNFAAQSNQANDRTWGSRGHFDGRKPIDDKRAAEVTELSGENRRCMGRRSLDTRSVGHAQEEEDNQEGSVHKENDNKQPSADLMEETQQTASHKFFSPPPGATTEAVFSPTPHLLKPSQMNLKTYSDDLFRKHFVEKGSSCGADVTQVSGDGAMLNIQESEVGDTGEVNKAQRLEENDIAKKQAFLINNELDAKFTALMDSVNERITTDVTTPKVASEPNDRIECSPTPHLLKPSKMNFKTAHSDKTTEPISDEKDMSSMNEMDLKYSALLESADTVITASNVMPPTFLSPASASKDIEYSPTPHLLKPSLMNFKNTCTEQITEPIDNESHGADNEHTLTSKLNVTAAPPKFLSPVQASKETVDCSPTPHLLKPSKMNFKSAYTDNLLRQNTSNSAPIRSPHGVSMTKSPHLSNQQSDFPTRFSDVMSPSNFPTKYSDKVSPQTSSHEVFSPSLTRFLYMSQSEDRDKSVDSSNKSSSALTIHDSNSTHKVDTDLRTTDTESFLPKEKVYSPLNAQMLSDMMGFTSSFQSISPAISSSRASESSKRSGMSSLGRKKMMTADETPLSQHDKSSGGILAKDDPSPIHTRDLFSDSFSFASGNNFGAETATAGVASTKSESSDKAKFFDSPFASEADVRFSTSPIQGIDFVNDQNNIDEKADSNEFAHFDKEWTASTQTTRETPQDAGDKSDDLGEELDNILSFIPNDTEEEQLPPVPSNDELHEDSSQKSNIFFGSRFNEELGTLEIKSIGSSGPELSEKLSTIDEADEDLAAQTKLFKDSLTPELSEFYSQINAMFDRKVSNLEKKVKSAAVENSVIKEEMCHQHQQIQSLMVQLEASRDMMQANQCLMQEIEELRAQLQATDGPKSKKGVGNFFSGKKKKTLKHRWL